MTDDDLWLPTPTVMDATRHTVRGCWRPGENWRGVSLNNAIMDAGEVIAAGTHTIHLSDEVTCLPTPTSDRWNGGACDRTPGRHGACGHMRRLGGEERRHPPAPHAGLHGCDHAPVFDRRSEGGCDDEECDRAATPTSRDGKGRNQRNTDDCMPVAADNMSITVPGPYHGGLWGLDDGRGVRFGRFTAAIRRWERVSGRPAPCPTQATGGLRRWIGANAADPTLFEPYWLARRAPFDAHPKARLDQPMRDRMLARWRETDRGMSLIDPMFWPGCKDMDPDIPIPATRLPDKSVLDYWKTRSVGSRFPSAAHLSPRFVEWMMGLEDGWVTNPAIWRHVDGNHRNLQLRALGNGVVPPQAAMAVDWALRVRERLAV